MNEIKFIFNIILKNCQYLDECFNSILKLNEEKYLHHVRLVFERFKEHDIVINLSKSASKS